MEDKKITPEDKRKISNLLTEIKIKTKQVEASLNEIETCVSDIKEILDKEE